MFLKIKLYTWTIAGLKRRERTLRQIRNEIGDFTTDATERQRFIRDHCEQVYTNKLGNLEEMHKFLETYSLARLNHEEFENLNRPVANEQSESVMRRLPREKPRTRWFHWRVPPDVQRKVNTSRSQAPSKYCRG